MLHDIGKIGVPATILDKPGALTDEEWAIMQSHVEQGVRIVEPIPQYAALLPMIAQHHERLDGSGYPSGLSGDEIHPYARILAVADTFDAMTMDRPYRTGLPWPDAVALIRSERGVKFDAVAVDAFLEILSERRDERAPAETFELQPIELTVHAADLLEGAA